MNELNGCRAFPKGETCPQEYCQRNQHRKMCLRNGKACQYWDGREISVYQEEKSGKEIARSKPQPGSRGYRVGSTTRQQEDSKKNG